MVLELKEKTTRDWKELFTNGQKLNMQGVAVHIEFACRRVASAGARAACSFVAIGRRVTFPTNPRKGFERKCALADIQLYDTDQKARSLLCLV